MFRFRPPSRPSWCWNRRALLHSCVLALLAITLFTSTRIVYATTRSLDGTSCCAANRAASLVCPLLLRFDHHCGGTQAADAATAAHLKVEAQQTIAGATTTLTVTLNTGGNEIAAATFALGLDPTVLHFDTTDSDEDGVPDAVTLHTPPGMSSSVAWNPDDKRLEVAVFGMSLPLPTLQDGLFATVTIAVDDYASTTSTPLALDLVSFSDPDGNDLLFTKQDSTLPIDISNVRRNVFLPLVVR